MRNMELESLERPSCEKLQASCARSCAKHESLQAWCEAEQPSTLNEIVERACLIHSTYPGADRYTLGWTLTVYPGNNAFEHPLSIEAAERDPGWNRRLETFRKSNYDYNALDPRATTSSDYRFASFNASQAIEFQLWIHETFLVPTKLIVGFVTASHASPANPDLALLCPLTGRTHTIYRDTQICLDLDAILHGPH